MTFNSPTASSALWLFSPRRDFWLACGGAPVGLMVAICVIILRGDRELDALDFVLSEFHLGATYDAILRRRLWRSRRVDVLLVPLAIVALTYALSMTGHSILLTSITMYAAVWHRGRQSFGVARFYQRGVGGPVSRAHDMLFCGAIYLPMVAAALAYGHLSPSSYEEKPYYALNFGADATALIGAAALLCVIAYGVWTQWPSDRGALNLAFGTGHGHVHPAERWVVLAHALAFGSAYLLGASNASFILVLAVHHEVQYLYFAYAMARHSENSGGHGIVAVEAVIKPGPKAADLSGGKFRTELKQAAGFIRWPVIGFAGAVFGGWAQVSWLAPLGMGGLFCHYWLDGRIWTRRSRVV